MNYFVTLNIQTNIPYEKLNIDISKPLLISGIDEPINITGIDAITQWNNSSNKNEEIKNISDALKEHKNKLSF
jgi:hypothetical protein